jgi:hypothetical protein
VRLGGCCSGSEAGEERAGSEGGGSGGGEAQEFAAGQACSRRISLNVFDVFHLGHLIAAAPRDRNGILSGFGWGPLPSPLFWG